MKKITQFLSSTIFFLIILFPDIAISQQQVTVGTGTAISVFSPINRTNDYCVYEVIYLASDIATGGNITNLAFERVDGTDTLTIQNVDIYMLHTTQTTLSAGTFDSTNYTHVYSGTFPNDIGAGWREVALDVPFMYNGSENLQVLVVKGYQPAVANTPVCVRWYYTNITPSPARARRYYGNTAISTSTSLSTTQFTSNVRLTFDIGTGVVQVVPGEFDVYPNPAMDKLSVAGYSLPGNCELEIYNTAGEKVYAQQLVSDNLKNKTIDISGLSRGMYFLKIKNQQEVRVAKFVKE